MERVGWLIRDGEGRGGWWERRLTISASSVDTASHPLTCTTAPSADLQRPSEPWPWVDDALQYKEAWLPQSVFE